MDNILINSEENVYTSGSLTTSISEQLPQFTITGNLLSDTLVKKDVKTPQKETSQSFIVTILLEISNQ